MHFRMDCPPLRRVREPHCAHLRHDGQHVISELATSSSCVIIEEQASLWFESNVSLSLDLNPGKGGCDVLIFVSKQRP